MTENRFSEACDCANHTSCGGSYRIGNSIVGCRCGCHAIMLGDPLPPKERVSSAVPRTFHRNQRFRILKSGEEGVLQSVTFGLENNLVLRLHLPLRNEWVVLFGHEVEEVSGV